MTSTVWNILLALHSLKFGMKKRPFPKGRVRCHEQIQEKVTREHLQKITCLTYSLYHNVKSLLSVKCCDRQQGIGTNRLQLKKT